MIFVTVGTHTKGFDRLIKAADEFASTSSERVVIQRGSSTYSPINAQSFQWATSNEIGNFIKEARIVISHAGAGTIIQVFQFCKPLVITPRLKQFGEILDDHQNQLTRALAAQGRVITLEEINCKSLNHAIKKAENLVMSTAGSEKLVSALQSQLKIWAEERETI